MPGAAERDKTHEFPAELVQQLGELGFMGMFVDPEYGGAGMDILSYVLALEEICYADAGAGVIMSVNNSLVCWPLMTFGTHEQKMKYLSPLASGAKLGCNINQLMLSMYGWCVIDEIAPGSMAESHGIKVGDRIVQCDDGDDDVDEFEMLHGKLIKFDLMISA